MAPPADRRISGLLKASLAGAAHARVIAEDRKSRKPCRLASSGGSFFQNIFEPVQKSRDKECRLSFVTGLRNVPGNIYHARKSRVAVRRAPHNHVPRLGQKAARIDAMERWNSCNQRVRTFQKLGSQKLVALAHTTDEQSEVFTIKSHACIDL
jgi:hypothetical protein